ncbi:MAG: phosphotransferase [Cyanobacteria bacterium P01_A01_bin.83]
MRVLSPYGKNVEIELKKIYGFNSLDATIEFIVRHLQQQYQLQEVEVESLHIAYGLVAKFKAKSGIYHLKFASRSMHPNPEQLFPWLDFARQQGVLAPEVVSTIDGYKYLSPLKNISSDYDIVYLMHNIPGCPMQKAREPLLRQYAEAMAQFHRVGLEYPHIVQGNDETWAGKWQDSQELYCELKDNPSIPQKLLSEAIQIIEKTKVRALTPTIIHGDFRFCHVFFKDNILSGLIDADESTQGERLIELCYGLVSGSSPASGSLLTFEQLRSTLAIYHQCLPLSKSEQSMLKGVFAWAFLETLLSLSESHATDQDISMTLRLFHAVLEASKEELLCRV